MLIQFTIGEFIAAIVALCGLITAVAAAVGVIISLVKKMRKPNEEQNTRLTELETRMAKVEKAQRKSEESDRIYLECMLALLSHGIDGNEIEAMRKAKIKLQEYLINQ